MGKTQRPPTDAVGGETAGWFVWSCQRHEPAGLLSDLGRSSIGLQGSLEPHFRQGSLARVVERYSIQRWSAVAHDGVVCLAEVFDRASRDLVTAVSLRAGTPVTFRTIVAVVCHEISFHFPCAHCTTLNFSARTITPNSSGGNY